MMTLLDSLLHGLLADIDSLTELKVTVFCVWAMRQRDNQPNGLQWVRRSDFDGPNRAVHGLSEAELEDGLARAVQRGTLRCLSAHGPAGLSETVYACPSPELDAALAESGGTLRLDASGHVAILPPRPTLYKLYEDNIGPLTGLIGDALRDLAADYGDDWLREAIAIAAERNKRSLSYIKGVLRGWRKDGKPHANAQRHPQSTEKPASGQFAEFFKR